MAVETKHDIMTHEEAHYFGNKEDAEINLGGVITALEEQSNPIKSEKQYISDKAKTIKTTGHSNVFPITMDMVQGDKVFDDFYDLFEHRKVGDELLRSHYIVKLYKPVSMKENTYEARKIVQSVSIESATSNPGEQKTMSGNLEGGDFEFGEFNISTKEFTPSV